MQLKSHQISKLGFLKKWLWDTVYIRQVQIHPVLPIPGSSALPRPPSESLGFLLRGAAR